MHLPFFETPRLHISILNMETLKNMFENMSKEEFCKVMGILNEEEFQGELDRLTGGLTAYNRTALRFLVARKSDMRIIAHVAFHNWFISHRRSEIGYNIKLEEDKQKGYMTEAVGAIIHYGFETLLLNRIEAVTAPDNIASRKVLEKHGFKEEGLLKSHYFSNGEFSDSVIYGLLQSEHLLRKQASPSTF